MVGEVQRTGATIVAGVLVAATVLAGCSAGGSGSSTSSSPFASTPTAASASSDSASSTDSSSSTEPPGAAALATEALFPSLSGFVAAFAAVGGSGAVAGAESFPLTLDSLVTGAVDAPTGRNGFITLDAIPGAALGGTYADDETVTAVLLMVDPRTASAASALIGLVGATIASAAQFEQAGFVAAYAELASEASTRTGEQRWIPSSNDSGFSLVLSVVEGDTPEANLIEVAIVPFATEAEAIAAARPIRNAVFALVA